MNTDTESVPGASVNQARRTYQSAAPGKKQAAGAKQKAAHAGKPTKAPRRPPRSSRAASRTEKLVCRYCGSDDLAPSFRKRRDARCRALLQEALWLGLAGQEDRAHSEDEGRQVIFGRGSNRSGSGLIEGLGPRSQVGSAFATRSNERLDGNPRLQAIRYQAHAPGRSRAKED